VVPDSEMNLANIAVVYCAVCTVQCANLECVELWATNKKLSTLFKERRGNLRKVGPGQPTIVNNPAARGKKETTHLPGLSSIFPFLTFGDLSSVVGSINDMNYNEISHRNGRFI
jgi:hypothetical protein